MKNNGTKTSKTSVNPFAFLVEDVANTTFKVVTDVEEGKHTVKCTDVSLLSSNNNNPKVQFVFNTRKGGTVVDNIPLSQYGDSLKVFNRVAYLLKDGQVEPESVTNMRQEYAKILAGATENTYIIESDIDTSKEIEEKELEGLSEKEAETAKVEHKKALRRAFRSDINAQKTEAYNDGFQIYEKDSILYAITPDVDVLNSLGDDLETMFQDVVGKNCTVEVKGVSKWYNGRYNTFLNVARYSK